MSDAQYSKEFFRRYDSVNAELKQLEEKTVDESDDRRDELMDEWMTLDMALGPVRKAMIEAAKRKASGKAQERTDK